MLVPYDMSSDHGRPPADGWQKVTAFGLISVLTTTVILVTGGSSSDMVFLTPVLLAMFNGRVAGR